MVLQSKKKRKEKNRNQSGHHVAQKTRKGEKRLKWKEEDMKLAVDAVKNGTIPVREAARTFQVPRATLQTRLTNKVAMGAKPGRPQAMTKEDERKLIGYAAMRAQAGIGFGKRQFLKFAGDISKKRNKPFQNGSPTDGWWRLLKKRNPDVVKRKPEPTAGIRHEKMTPKIVAEYFKALKKVMDEHDLHSKPHTIWNMDETGVALEHKPTKVVTVKGMRHLHGKTGGSREMFTVIACGNASGKTLPPHIVVKGKTKQSLKSLDSENAPTGTELSVSPTGWTRNGIALLWFTNVFLKGIGEERPQLLVVDGHESHCFVELIEKAREEKIIIVEMPAHTSNWLQPLDRTAFFPLKTAYNDCISSKIVDNPHFRVEKKNFFTIFRQAWEKGLTPDNLKSGFAACGIYPFDPNRIPEEAYAPSSLYSNAGISEISATTSAATPTDRRDLEHLDQHLSTNSTPRGLYSDPRIPEFSTPTTENHTMPSVTLADGLDHQVQFSTPTAASKEHSNLDLIQNFEEDYHYELISEIEDIDVGLNEIIQQSNISISSNNDACTTNDFPTADPESIGLPGSNRECPPDLAFAALNLSLQKHQLDRFEMWYRSGIEKPDDRLYCTWRRYKQACTSNSGENTPPLPTSENTNAIPASSFYKPKTSARRALMPMDHVYTEADEDDDVLPSISSKVLPAKSTTRRHSKEAEYFILTADYIYKQKVEQAQKKKENEEAKEMRKKQRAEAALSRKEAANAKKLGAQKKKAVRTTKRQKKSANSWR